MQTDYRFRRNDCLRAPYLLVIKLIVEMGIGRVDNVIDIAMQSVQPVFLSKLDVKVPSADSGTPRRLAIA